MRPFTGGKGAVVSFKLLYDGKKCVPPDESRGARVTVDENKQFPSSYDSP